MSAPSNAASNKDIVRGLYEAFGKGDAGSVLAAFDADIVWNEAENHTFAGGNPYKGANAILNGIFMRLAVEWEDFKVVPHHYAADGERVLVEGRYRGKCKATGAEIDAQFVHAWTLASGKVTSFQQYTDTAQWQQATATESGMNRVVHFEIGAQDPERCAKFYSDVFGWQIARWEGGPTPYWLATTGPKSGIGINGGILRHPDGAARTINTIAVDSIEKALDRITQAGGKMEMPKMAIPGVGWLAYAKDTEGGMFGIHVPDPSAK